MLKKILIGLGLIASLVLVFYLTRAYYTWSDNIKAEEQSEVLMEKVKTVAKLVTVEGYFSEVYSYQDYWKFDLSWFQKKALIRVKAKVSVGYDLGKMSIEALPQQKKIVISNLPDPQIISIDHDLDYYDLDEGSFNSFDKDDYNKINSNAKEKIRQAAEASDIFLTAETQSNEMFELIQFIVEGAGWELEYTPRIEQTDTLPQ